MAEPELSLSMANIVAHVGEGKRCWEEGEAVLKAKHIVACGVVTRETDEVKVLALCAQSSNLRAKPHEIVVTIRSEGFKISCSCKAGMSEKCKHCVAVLLYLNRKNVLELEDLSSTDVTQAWGTLKDPAWYAPTPLKDFCHVAEKKQAGKYQPLNAEESRDLKRILLEAAPSSALAMHEKRKRGEVVTQEKLVDPFISQLIGRTSGPVVASIPPGVLSDAFYVDQVVLGVTECEELCAATVDQSHSQEWKSARRVRITASSCYQLYTYSGSSWDKLLERTFSSSFKGNMATRFGQENEGRARELYRAATGADVRMCGLVVPPLAPWLGCSPDGVVLGRDGEMRLVEIKCPFLCKDEGLETLVAEKKLPYLVQEGENLRLKSRHNYFGQIQLMLELLDIDVCDLCVYVQKDDRIVLVKVSRDRLFGSQMVARLTTVYFNRVLPFLKAKYA